MLLSRAPLETVLTTAFSGKLSRGIRNQFTVRMPNHQKDIIDYPIQNALTQSMHKVAAKQNNTDFMSMWAGEFFYECRDISATALMNELIYDLQMGQ